MTKEHLENLINSKIHEVFLEYQENEDIADGGISPEHAVVLDSIVNDLSDLVIASMEKKPRGLTSLRFLEEYDTDLHRIYYAMHACWYGTEDAKAYGLDKPYTDWATDWYMELSQSCRSRSDFEDEISSTLAYYSQPVTDVFNATKLCEIYSSSDIDALCYMKKHLKGELRELCEQTIRLNTDTTLGFGDDIATNEQADAYIAGKEKLLKHFGLALELGEPVYGPDYQYTGKELITYLPSELRSRVTKAILTDLNGVEVLGLSDLHHQISDGRLCDLENFEIDWKKAIGLGVDKSDDEDKEL